MTSVSNSPIETKDAHTLTQDGGLNVYILPSWVHKAFTAKYSLSDIHDYAKLRSVISAVDVAHLEVLRRKLFQNVNLEDSYECMSFAFPNWGDNKTPIIDAAGLDEVRSTIAFLLQDPRTEKEALGRLLELENQYGIAQASPSLQGLEATKTENLPYRVIYLNDALYITVEEGFLSHLRGTVAARKTFLTQILKSAYAIAPISVVNRSGFYRQYLNTLAA